MRKFKRNKTSINTEEYNSENSLYSMITSDPESIKNNPTISSLLNFISNKNNSSSDLNPKFHPTVILRDVDYGENHFSIKIEYIDDKFFLSLFKEEESNVDHSKVPYMNNVETHYASIGIPVNDLYSALNYLSDHD